MNKFLCINYRLYASKYQMHCHNPFMLLEFSHLRICLLLVDVSRLFPQNMSLGRFHYQNLRCYLWTQLFSSNGRVTSHCIIVLKHVRVFQLWILPSSQCFEGCFLHNIGIMFDHGNSTCHFLTYSSEKAGAKKGLYIKLEGLLSPYFWGATSGVFWRAEGFW